MGHRGGGRLFAAGAGDCFRGMTRDAMKLPIVLGSFGRSMTRRANMTPRDVVE